MRKTKAIVLVLLILALFALPLFAAGQTEVVSTKDAPKEFSWTRFEGDKIHFLANNNPIGQLFMKYAPEFTEMTGIEVEVSLFAEQQFRQRLQTVMQAGSEEVDIFMSLVSREGQLYNAAGWYLDLYPLLNDPLATSPDYKVEEFGKGVLNASVLDGTLTGVPNNIEGPVLYYRSDILKELNIAVPTNLTELRAALVAVKKGRPDMIPFASRGLAPAAPYTFSNFLHNFGGDYVGPDGMSNLSSPEGIAAIEFYAELLRDFGPPGVINYSYPQLTAVNSNGQCVFTFESSNEFSKVMENTQRTKDTSIIALPQGSAGSVPVVIGWQLSVSPHSEKQQQAWYFLQWATSREMQSRLALEGLAPPRTTVMESQEFGDWLKELPVRGEWGNALNELSSKGSSVLAPQIILQPETREIIGQAVGKVILGEATAKEAAKEADDRINVIIERSNKLK